MVHFASPQLCFSPVGEALSFAWPKESAQRKGHPWCVGLRLPCDARRPRRVWNSPWQGTQNVPCCGTQTPSPFSPRPAALLGDTQGAPDRAPVLGYDGPVHADGRSLSPSALPIWRVRAGHTIFHGFQPVESRSPLVGKKQYRVRAPQHGAICAPCQGELVERPPVRAKSGTRRAAMWGRLFLGDFLLAKQKKVTRPKAKSEAVVHARYSRNSQRAPI
jgi:hypothetical protein